MTSPPGPDYGRSTLGEVLPAVAAQLGVPGAEDVLGLPEGQRFVVFMVDGLGWRQLLPARDVAPRLAALAEAGRPISCGVPSTTGTSITSLGTGLAPGEHGVAGYSFRFGGALLNVLNWSNGVDGLDVQPRLTYLERLAKAGVAVWSVTPARFRRSGLTTCALRGATFIDVHDERDQQRRAELAVQAALAAPRSVVYLYERSLDQTGHTHGVASSAWREELARVDSFLGILREALPDDVHILLTGDHGMVDVPFDERVTIQDEPALREDVVLIGGEPRLRQLYTRPGRTAAVQNRWLERLGKKAWVLTRDEAIAAGWFGPTSPRLADRFGDVLVAMRDNSAVMSRTQPKEFDLVGMHGSLTDDEMLVPFLIG